MERERQQNDRTLADGAGLAGVVHPHAENGALRQRATSFYKIFGYTEVREMHRILKDMQVDYLVFDRCAGPTLSMRLGWAHSLHASWLAPLSPCVLAGPTLAMRVLAAVASIAYSLPCSPSPSTPPNKSQWLQA